MKIEFITEKYVGSWSESEIHTVKCDGRLIARQSDGMEPEDTEFYRDLCSPHYCDTLIKKVILATKAGEEVEFIYTTNEDEED